jgi:hypothetical protein
MSSDPEERSPARAVDEADASAEMESKLDQLDEHITDARKKADDGRPLGEPAGDDDPLDDVAGGGTDNAEEADDPAGPIIGPE